MKKLKPSVIIPLIALLLGIVIAISGLVMGAVKDYKANMNLRDFESYVETMGIMNFDISVDIADIVVTCKNDIDEIHIIAEGISKDYLQYSTSNNTFKLTYEVPKWYHAIYIPGYLKNMGKICINIPADMTLHDIQLKGGYGVSDLSYITAEKIYFDCGTGNGFIKDFNCQYTEINSSGGKLNTVNINADNADLNLNSGEAELLNFVTDSLIMNNKRCNVNLSGLINGSSSVKTGSGNVNMTIYGDKKNFSFNTVNGDVIVNDEKNPENTKGKFDFIVECGSGDINIDFK